MTQMTNQNLRNIKDRFERETGVSLRPCRSSMRKGLVLAVTVAMCFVLAAFTAPLFTPLDGDALSLSASYQGDGILSICIMNGSDKDLALQKQAKLMNWRTGEEVERLDGKILFENTKIPAHSTKMVTVDLSGAYDIPALEGEGKNFERYYLLLTNNNFLFGHDWMCSFSFNERPEETMAETDISDVQPDSIEEIEESLRFYFEDAYHDEVMGLNEQNIAYVQAVETLMEDFEGTLVHPVYPTILVGGPSTVLEPQPHIRLDMDADYLVPEEGIGTADWTPLDGYSRLIGATVYEKALTISAHLPLAQYDNGVSSIPLVYTLVYEADAAKDDAWTFFYGQFHSFGELERCRVYQDEHYVIYNITDYLYTDLDTYLDYIHWVRTDIRMDENTRGLVHQLYETYMDADTIKNTVYYPGEVP